MNTLSVWTHLVYEHTPTGRRNVDRQEEDRRTNTHEDGTSLEWLIACCCWWWWWLWWWWWWWWWSRHFICREVAIVHHISHNTACFSTQASFTFAWRPASHRGEPCSIAGQSLWYLWRTLSVGHFGCPLSVSFHHSFYRTARRTGTSTEGDALVNIRGKYILRVSAGLVQSY
jgi:hypothetical protein